MKRILLMGNPNVGKSVVFSRLTGVRVVSSNYPGTTVEFTQGTMMVEDERAVLIDAPGIYGLEATCKAEEIAVEMIGQADAVINVVDATNLERSLHLTLHLLERRLPMVVALNIWDDAKHKGIEIDVARLRRELGVAVVPTVAVTGEGIKELVESIGASICAVAGDGGDSMPKRGMYCSSCLMKSCCGGDTPERAVPQTEEERWREVGRILSVAQSLKHRHHTFLEVLGDASVHPIIGIPIAAMVLCLSFIGIRIIGEGLIDLVFEPAFNTFWLPVLLRINGMLAPNGPPCALRQAPQ